MSRLIRLSAAVCLAVTAMPAIAQEHDSGVWTSATGTIEVAPRLQATMEVHTRFTDDASRLGQLLLRPSLTYQIGPRVSMTAGYAYVRTDPPGPQRSDEHRSWQQLGYTFASTSKLDVSGRTRIEQRFVEGASGTGWRLRQQIRAALPLGAEKKPQALVWNETFLSLNDTGWGQRAGFDQTRTFVGAAVPLSAKSRLEPGYLNQTVFRRGEDRINHILAANLFFRL